MVFPSKTKFFEGTKSKFAKIKNLHLENIGRKVCIKFGERRSNRFRIKSGEVKEKMVFPSTTKFLEGKKSKLNKIKNLHLENMGRKVCMKFDERK